MKKLLSLLLIMVLTLSCFTACGNDEPAGGEETTEPIVVKLCWETNMDDVIGLSLQKWAEEVDKISEGQMKIELYPASQLGAKNDLIDQMLAGAPVITLVDGAYMADRGIPDMSIHFAPYLYDSWDDAWALTESEWWADMTQQCADNGIRLLTSNWIYGARNLVVNKEVRTPDDLKGMLIRVPNNVTQVQGMEALGATATPLAYADIYTGLQQGTIDGMEAPLPQILSMGFAEVAEYIIINEHNLNTTIWCTSNEWFEGLTEEQQQWLCEAGDIAGEYNQKLYFEEEAAAKEQLIANGAKVIELTDEERAQWKEAAQSFYTSPAMQEMWSEGLYETVLAAMGK